MGKESSHATSPAGNKYVFENSQSHSQRMTAGLWGLEQAWLVCGKPTKVCTHTYSPPLTQSLGRAASFSMCVMRVWMHRAFRSHGSEGISLRRDG